MSANAIGNVDERASGDGNVPRNGIVGRIAIRHGVGTLYAVGMHCLVLEWQAIVRVGLLHIGKVEIPECHVLDPNILRTAHVDEMIRRMHESRVPNNDVIAMDEPEARRISHAVRCAIPRSSFDGYVASLRIATMSATLLRWIAIVAILIKMDASKHCSPLGERFRSSDNGIAC